jgi:hypothetical protein
MPGHTHLPHKQKVFLNVWEGVEERKIVGKCKKNMIDAYLMGGGRVQYPVNRVVL